MLHDHDVVASSSKEGVTPSNDVSCLGTTRVAITSAMTSLSDNRNGFHDSSEVLQDSSLDDSGIVISDSDIDDGNKTSYNEDSCKNLKVLRERIAKLEKENHRLKAQLGVYEMTGKCQFSFLFPILSVGTKPEPVPGFLVWNNEARN